MSHITARRSRGRDPQRPAGVLNQPNLGNRVSENVISFPTYVKLTAFPICIFAITVSAACLAAGLPVDYKGKPFEDERYKAGPQKIPGRLEVAYFDLGGEGVAYHDTDELNNGSGKLNYEQNSPSSGGKRPDDYVAHFREKEAVDLSYTKDRADFKHPNLVNPPPDQFYIGWQADGEWTNYTVDVKTAGRYRIVALYGNRDNGSSFWINGVEAAKIKIPVDTGSMHKWNKAEVGEITFPKMGLNLLTLKLNAGANLAYFDFELMDATEPSTAVEQVHREVWPRSIDK